MSELETTIRCPHCQRDFSLPLMALVPGSSRACPHCGTSIRFAGQDGGKVQQAIDQITSLAGANVKVTVKVKQKRPWWKFWG